MIRFKTVTISFSPDESDATILVEAEYPLKREDTDATVGTGQPANAQANLAGFTAAYTALYGSAPPASYWARMLATLKKLAKDQNP